MDKRRFFCIMLLLVLLVIGLAPAAVGAAKPPRPVVNVRLTSITIDPEDATGTTTNAPGAWSTAWGDVLCAPALLVNGKYVNNPAFGYAFGEIDIPLVAGNNVIKIQGGAAPGFGQDAIFPWNLYYGAVLFFDGQLVGPQIAVYNANGAGGAFSVQPAGTDVMPRAYYEDFIWDHAPGTSVYTAPDGTTVTVTKWTINALDSAVDKVSSCYNIGPDGYLDAVAQLTLKVTPP